MISSVVSHTWRRKGFSSILLELRPVRASDTKVALTIQGRSEESTPYLVAASAAVSPLHGNHDGSALQDCVLEGYIMSAQDATIVLTLQPSHRFLRLDCIGRLHMSLGRTVGDGGTDVECSRATEAAMAFDHVTHHITVTLDDLSESACGATTSPPKDRRERQGIADSSGRSSSPRLTPSRIISKPQPATTPARARSPNVARKHSTLAAARDALQLHLSKLQEEIAWYRSEDQQWTVERLEYIRQLRGGAAILRTPSLPTL